MIAIVFNFSHCPSNILPLRNFYLCLTLQEDTKCKSNQESIQELWRWFHLTNFNFHFVFRLLHVVKTKFANLQGTPVKWHLLERLWRMLTVPDLEEDVAGEHAHQLIIYLTNTSVVLWIRGGQIEISSSIHEFVSHMKSMFNKAILR